MTHRLEFCLEPWGLTCNATCDASAGADCRMICPVGCETWPCEHEPVDYGRCNVVEWLNADGVIDCYRGEPTSVRDGDIVVTWDNGYIWSYVDSEVKP